MCILCVTQLAERELARTIEKAAEERERLRRELEEEKERLQREKEAEVAEFQKHVDQMKQMFSQLEGNQKALDQVVRDALDGKLITHEQQYKARSILYYEQLKQVPPVFSEGSMTWRSRADAPPGTPIPETLLPGAQQHLLISSGSRRSPSTVRRMLRQDE